jgi:hypothetical protein
MRRNVEIWQFLLALIGAVIACSLWLNDKGSQEGKWKENVELRLQLMEKNMASYNDKQDKIMEALTDIKLTLKDKADRR